MTELDAKVEEKITLLLTQLTRREKAALLSGKDVWRSMPIERLGIPSIIMTDGPHGVRADMAEANRPTGLTTAFPTGKSMAASWDVALIERVGEALGEETHGMGCDILLGPCVNIVRTPLAGRNFETYSEDPYLAGRIGVAWVRGLQNKGVGASLKHYACNNQEIERGRSSSNLDERTLREIYLAQFETIVRQAQPWTVMCSYNRINGVYASQNHYLLKDILKEEWGFQGLVVSDWGANHTVFESVEGGLDLEMPGPAHYYGRLLEESLSNWQIEEADLDEAARRVLRILFKSGRMDGSLVDNGRVNTPEHQALARQLAEESIVLLKNEADLLPLKRGQVRTLAVIGPNAVELLVSGGGSSRVRPPYSVNAVDGFKALLGEKVKVSYAQGCDNYVELPTIKPAYLSVPDGSRPGMQGEYFNQPDFNAQPALTRIDRRPEFWWFSNGPDERITNPAYAARWQAQLKVPQSGSYHLKLYATDLGKVYLDEDLVAAVDQYELTPDRSERFLYLEAGKPYSLRIEYIHPEGGDFTNLRLALAYAPKPEEDDRFESAVTLAKNADAAVVVVGLPENYETEGWDRPDLQLTGRQNELVQAILQANPKTVVVLNCGAPVSLPWLANAPALLQVHYPGMEGGSALARVLFGEVNPSGKLTETYPERLEDNPAYLNSAFPGAREVLYGEGIFVGYRYYDRKQITPAFPFGFGLSYTHFAYTSPQAPEQISLGEGADVSVEVKNTGGRAGKEVVQLYVRDVESSLPRPDKELKGFAKLSLEPGEQATAQFHLEPRDLSFYDPYRKQWVCEPGRFEVLFGSSSRHIHAQAVFTVK